MPSTPAGPSATGGPCRSVLRHAVFLVGPTSVGKSAIALAWAEKYGAEIVCADAFQLYREFPVLSARPTEAEMARAPHHLFGSVSCTETMDAARFAADSLAVIADITARGRTPLIVGGSGLYIDALIRGLPDLPVIDPEIRRRIRAMPPGEMLEELQRRDPASVVAIDAHNPRRVARRLELTLQTGAPASEILAPRPLPEGLRGVVFTRDREDLRARIADAVTARLDGGAIDEVRGARSVAGPTARQILGWRQIGNFLDGVCTRDACREQLVDATRRYAKRQLTWFRAKSTFPAENLSTVIPSDLDRLALQLGLP